MLSLVYATENRLTGPWQLIATFLDDEQAADDYAEQVEEAEDGPPTTVFVRECELADVKTTITGEEAENGAVTR